LFLSALWIWLAIALRHLKALIIKKKERKKRAQNSLSARQQLKSKPKVTIVKKGSSKPEVPEQKHFSFMNMADNFELPSIDLLNDPPDKKDHSIKNESLEMNAKRLEKKLGELYSKIFSRESIIERAKHFKAIMKRRIK